MNDIEKFRAAARRELNAWWDCAVTARVRVVVEALVEGGMPRAEAEATANAAAQDALYAATKGLRGVK